MLWNDGRGKRWWVALAPIIAVGVSIWLAYLPLRPRWHGDRVAPPAPVTSAAPVTSGP